MPIQVVQVGGANGVRDPLGDWAGVRGVGEDGAVLVRPDAHVAWRAADASLAGDLAPVIRRLLLPTGQHLGADARMNRHPG